MEVEKVGGLYCLGMCQPRYWTRYRTGVGTVLILGIIGIGSGKYNWDLDALLSLYKLKNTTHDIQYIYLPNP